MKIALILSLLSFSVFSVESNCPYYLDVISPVQEGPRAALIENVINGLKLKNYEITPYLSKAKHVIKISSDVVKEGNSFVYEVTVMQESLSSDLKDVTSVTAKNMKLAAEEAIATIKVCE